MNARSAYRNVRRSLTLHFAKQNFTFGVRRTRGAYRKRDASPVRIKERGVEKMTTRGALERGICCRAEYGKDGSLIIYIDQTGPETYLEELLAFYGLCKGVVLK